jgi:hypothetical protein
LRVSSLRRRGTAPRPGSKISRAESFDATTRITLSMTMTPSRMLSIVASNSAPAGTSPAATAPDSAGVAAPAAVAATRADAPPVVGAARAPGRETLRASSVPASRPARRKQKEKAAVCGLQG